MKKNFKHIFHRTFLVAGLFFMSQSSHASIERAYQFYRSKGVKAFPQVAKELIREGLYFTAAPFLKEYLVKVRGAAGGEIDGIIDQVITQVGVKQFEVLPIQVLRKSQAPMVKYILAKKLFRRGQYRGALELLGKSVKQNANLRPFSLMLRASILSITKKYSEAVRTYEQCIDASDSELGKAGDETRKRQLLINRDYCVIGIPRAQFAAKNNKAANLAYLDLPKESHIWPEILFEEAWNSFYLRDYNRTLGKLVTYKAPVFSNMFNPEIEILKALTFLDLCLWADAGKVVNDFYNKFGGPSKGLSAFLRSNGKDYKFFYLIAKKRTKGKLRGSKLLNRLIKAATRDPIYQELHASFLKGSKELRIVKNMGNKRFRKILRNQLKDALVLQRNLIGGYVRKALKNYEHQIMKTFEGMSYIKLEVLSRKKSALYSTKNSSSRERGDVQFLKRNDKQYFWTFNGEFWADELGDYVFALNSECRK